MYMFVLLSLIRSVGVFKVSVIIAIMCDCVGGVREGSANVFKNAATQQ